MLQTAPYLHPFAGCDEAGRGCLAGPVVAAAVILAPHTHIPGLKDSKKLTAVQRTVLLPILKKKAISWALGQATPKEIDTHNIAQATYLAMHRAIQKLQPKPFHLLIDGKYFKPYAQIPHTCVIKGDDTYTSIAAAAIFAKVYRDQYMLQLALKYPSYHWHTNKGYPTLAHKKAIHTHGLTQHHRRTFRCHLNT